MPCVAPRKAADFERSKGCGYAGMDRPIHGAFTMIRCFIDCVIYQGQFIYDFYDLWNNVALSQLPGHH
jgi:hypothetical protein